jgi:hypothetical protein
MQPTDFTLAPGFEWFPVAHKPGWFHLSASGATHPHDAHCVLDASDNAGVISLWPDGGSDLAAFRSSVSCVREWYAAHASVTCPFVWSAA